MDAADTKSISVLRILRILRPLRTISRIPSVKVVVESLIRSGPSLFYTVFLYMFFLALFAQVFLLFYVDRFNHRCGHNEHSSAEGEVCNSDVEEPGE
mmetsp:Transcript_63134/g.173282  ORF Transcript_63134/g.173282 Transcript_63134/m.173282 type:complete len:97 (-) Transcript_63134:930-1220(-)